MRFLLDTNVVGELRKGTRADARVRAWLGGLEPNTTMISVLTIGEIRRGIESVRRRDAMSAEAIERWLYNLIADHREHILPVDLPVAEEWGRMNVSTTLPVIDGLLAATAKIHGLILATRNVKDVSRTGIQVVNPFDA